jgi:glycosyltransferase involved in cell wall biosynthesis
VPEGSQEIGWSLAMIVRDAEPDIGQVLDDAAVFCDELIVVDTGSKDLTKEVAAAHGARIVEFEWIDDFSAARNASFDECAGRWILWLDADDRIPPDAQQGFLELKNQLAERDGVNAVSIPYRRHFAESDPSVCTFSFLRERVVRRAAGPRWVGPVHEVIEVPGSAIEWTKAWVEHRPRSEDRPHKVDRNLRILERSFGQGDRSPRTLFYLGNELRDHQRWEEAIEAYKEYLAGAEIVVWERYWALLSTAQCMDHVGRIAEKLEVLLSAVNLDSTRAEAFMRLGLHYYGTREWEQAAPFFAAASVLQRPKHGFIDDMAYTWGPWDYLSICHSELGMYEQAIEETMRALRTSHDRERLFDNLKFYLDQLK